MVYSARDLDETMLVACIFVVPVVNIALVAQIGLKTWNAAQRSRRNMKSTADVASLFVLMLLDCASFIKRLPTFF